MSTSSQINFFLMPEDILEMDAFLKVHQCSVVAEPMPSQELKFINSILVNGNEKINKKYIIRNLDIPKISIKEVKQQNYYLVNETISPCIEIIYPKFEKNKDKQLNRGRVYYNKFYYDTENKLTYKDESFLKYASDFFKWIKKHFQNVKLKNYEDFLVSEKTLKWVQSGGTLSEYNLTSKYKQDQVTQEKMMA